MKQEIINRDKFGMPIVAETVGYNQINYIQKGLLFSIVCVVLTASIYFVFGVPIVPGAITFKTVLIPAIAYIATGLLFSIMVYSKHNFLNKLRINGSLQYVVIVFACVFLVSLLIGFLKKNGTDSFTSCLFYSSLFLLPAIIYQTWIFFSNSVANAGKNVWYLPEITSHVPVATVFLNSIRIRIKIAPTHGAEERLFDTTVPGRLSLGNAFSNFIYDEINKRKESISIEDEDNRLYGWKFLTPTFLGLGRRQINPDLSLNENQVKNNSVIIVRRTKNESLNQHQLSVL